MSSAVSSYIATLLIYLGVNGIACWALNLQFGVGGVMNFAFIIYQAIGAYITAVLTLPSARTLADETYILGWHLPWPLPLLGAAIAGALLALAVGSFSLRPRRRDFQATVMLVVSIIAATLVSTEQGWFNGNQGLFGIPQPFAASLSLSITGYYWFFFCLTAVFAAGAWFVTARLAGSPWGRRLRAMRENAEAIESLGTNTRKESLKVYVIGGALGALSGGLLVEVIAAWSPAAWGTGETFIYFVAIIVGGLGNSFGSLFGAFLVLGVFLELPTFLPQMSNANIEESLQSAFIGVLILVFLWWRPQGIFPERRRKLSGLLSVADREAAVVSAAAEATDRAVEKGVAAVLTGERAPAPVPERAPATLSVRDLRVSFGGVQAVGGLSFDLAPGLATGLIGPNGAGKSTALKLIAGAVRPQGGQVLVDGTDVAGWPAHRVARLGLIRTFQHTSEFGKLTVLENLLTAAPGQPGDSAAGALLGPRHARRRQQELLGQAWALLVDFGLTAHADSYAGQLSGGQRRLVEIMRSLMAQPRILLLDEPMAGVNPTLRLTIEEHLKRLRDGGLTMLMIEHELGSVERVC
ncbi:MAG TPA: ATP-binding cassette domain-containing protein, partial [Streptosporangiaceae bacterium]|nr:ATP-binding cassette domain-containing protein [Streptosporangiaceae bacterium]